MIPILAIGIGGLFVLMVSIIWHAMDDWSDGPMFLGFVGVAALVVAIGMGIGWYSADRKAALLNATYGTNYTASELFWSGEVVMQRIEGFKIHIEK